jgi:hypothetical protein
MVRLVLGRRRRRAVGRVRVWAPPHWVGEGWLVSCVGDKKRGTHHVFGEVACFDALSCYFGGVCQAGSGGPIACIVVIN